MTDIRFSLAQPIKSKTGAAAMLRRLADADGRPVPTSDHALSIPDGGVTLALDPGVYVIEACLPYGQVVSDQLVVASGSSGFDVQISNLAPVERQTRSETSPSDDIVAFTDRFSYPSASGQGGRGFDERCIPNHSHVELLVLSHDKVRCDWNSVLSTSSPSWTHLDAVEGTITRLDDDEHYKIRRPYNLRQRCWSQVWVSGQSRLVSLPFEPTETSPSRTVEICVGAERGALRLLDEHVGLLCDYLATDDFGPAGVTVDEIARKIRVSNLSDLATSLTTQLEPSGVIGACAIAYAATMSHRSDKWISMISKLSCEDWLPDGGILAAHYQLFQINTHESWKESGRLFRKSLDQGVPYFSLGLSLLVEGLTVLSSFEESYETDLALVKTVARRAKRGEAFSTFTPLHA